MPEGFEKQYDPILHAPAIEDPRLNFFGFSLAGYDGIGFGNIWLKEPDNTYNFVDTLSWVHGRHAFKMGVDIQRWHNNLAESAPYSMAFDGRFTGNSVADMLLAMVRAPPLSAATSGKTETLGPRCFHTGRLAISQTLT